MVIDTGATDLGALHDSIIEIIRTEMPMLKTVKSYDPTERDAIKTPALMLELVEMKPGRKLGDGRLSLTAEFAAHCCLSVKTDRVEIEIRNFAAKLLQVVNGNKWGLADAVERPTDLAAFPGMFKPDDKGFESWVVVWEQTIHLGEVWQDADFLPTDVYVGEAPDIGAAHEDKYWKITDD